MSYDFGSIIDALKGETVLVQPRVSRESIIYVLKEHTQLLMEVRKDVDKVKETSVELKKEAAENKKAMVELNYSVMENRKHIKNLQEETSGMREEIEALRSKISEIDDLRDLIKEQKVFIDDLKAGYEIFKQKTNEFEERTKESIETIDKKANDTAFETKELKHIVDHFGDNLILSSTQITVESTAGFSKRPQALLDVLKTCHSNMSSTEKTLADYGNRIVENHEAISTKADATVAFAVQTLDKDVLAIKNHLKKEEDQGISAIRRTCDTLTVAVEGLQAGLIDKIDRNVAELIVQKKYEDIVQYLQDALEASSEDEDNFKNIALELEEKMKKLASSKSDRLEIQPIQESLVKAEASIAKLMSQTRDAGKSEDVFSKDEVLELLDGKVDKDHLDDMVNQVIKNRRGKKFSVVVDDTTRVQTATSAQPTSRTDRTTDSHFPHEDIAQQGASQVVASARERLSGSGFPVSTPGVFRTPTEGGRPGGAPTHSAHSHTQPAHSLHHPHIHHPQAHHPPPPKALQSSTAPASNSSVYGSTGSQYRGVPPGGFPPANGAIALNRDKSKEHPNQSGRLSRQASADMPTMYYSRRSESMNDDDISVGDPRSRNASPDRSQRDEYSHLGAVTRGGGFNTRQSSTVGARPTINQLSSALSHANSEVSETMMQGADGHFYIADEDNIRPASSGGHPIVSSVKLSPPSPVASPNPTSGTF
mmetsp:Transcript_10099/g.15305  ORF Transcript_10099/g.15305 Transcript_10099/m.15305 type:complete len:708 (+) Transcript_10099:173-2296(+)|eukprot:CAMPEP_0185040194 /NCGR_PEP_ID=MMETSP1103-20130426/37969_1 /TAXON_ID=36769 /ORGANISM="Paraphysomonas bandaiensis, Strain Caron Lab Isolate" /LENGTH=707 /DNA_ID=CAMNT_0027579391 /DNA_START=96 /DNA_END=2219 /DNA_ORIENTATION=+